MRCVIIAGSPDADAGFIRDHVGEGDYVICADSGYDHARSAGIMPQLIVGDFDSCRELPPGGSEVVRLNVRKNDSDTHACARIAIARGFRDIVITGATGGRLDHTLANLCVLDFLVSHGARVSLVSKTETVTLLTGGSDTEGSDTEGSYTFEDQSGKTFSLIPFGADRAVASIENADYPASRLEFECSATTGLSNVFKENCRITVHSGRLLLIINEKDG